MKRAKHSVRKFAVELNGPHLYLKGTFSANDAARLKANPWQIFKPVRKALKGI